MRLPLLIFLFVWALSLKAQVNLVPNPSFEEIDTCPSASFQIEMAPPWLEIYGGSNYYHECGTNGYGIPINNSGEQEARTGQGYIGSIFWAYYPIYEGKFLGTQLTSTLINGKKYFVEFYISRMDNSWYAIKNIGIYFSQNQPQANINELLNYEPQVKYSEHEFLDDKEGWIKIEGSFYADGGEQFITIGNFDGHNNSDTLFVGGGVPPLGQPDYYKHAGYYIDDVSVTLDTTTSIPETEKPKLKIFPNPAGNQITIEQVSATGNQLSVEVYDALGRLVTLSVAQEQQTTIPLNLSKGVYLLRVKEKEEVVFWEKLIIE
jgi:hypothetical protein